MNDDHHLMLEHSVIRIIGANGKTAGTGFVVAEGLAVTCAHVIKYAKSGPGERVRVAYYALGEHAEPVEADVLHTGWSWGEEGEAADTAFLRLPDLPEGIRPAWLASPLKSRGHRSLTLGYPDRTGEEGRATPSLDVISSVLTDGAYPWLMLQSGQLQEGFSGAPILDLELDRVVGMVRFGYNQQRVVIVQAVTADTLKLMWPELRLDGAPIPGLPPQGILPDPADPPPGSRLPFVRNALFTGREDDLHALAAELLYRPNGKTVALTQPVAAAGMGGIGKTSLAAEFCYRYGQFCDGVHWINAANPDSIGAEIAACGLSMGIQPWPETQPEQIQTTLREWAKSRRRIVVLDNLEDPSALGEWLPELKNVHVLATTRRVEWPPEFGLQIQRLERFPRAESLRLLRKVCLRLESEPDETLAELAELLCDLPLAVDLAGRYLNNRPSLTSKEYAQELKDKGVLTDRGMKGKGVNIATRHKVSLEGTFELSWLELEQETEDEEEAQVLHLARLAFRCAGYCAPATSIPDPLLWLAVRTAVDPKEEDKNFDATYDIAMTRLYMLGLLEVSKGSQSIHPLLGEFARGKDGEQPEGNRILPVLAKVLAWISKKANETGLPANFLLLRPHLAAVVTYGDNYASEEGIAILNNLGVHLYMVADFVGALRLHEIALKNAELLYGSIHHVVAVCNSTIGIDLYELGDFQGAKTRFEMALAIGKQALGPVDQNVAVWANNLGSVLQALGDLKGAKVYIEQALFTVERILGKDNPGVAIYSNSLGRVLHNLGDLAGAKAHFERALTLAEHIYGKEHPDVAIYLNNLGGVLKDLGDLAGAKAHFEQAMRIFIKFLPDAHPNIRVARDNLEALEAKLRTKG